MIIRSRRSPETVDPIQLLLPENQAGKQTFDNIRLFFTAQLPLSENEQQAVQRQFEAIQDQFEAIQRAFEDYDKAMEEQLEAIQHSIKGIHADLAHMRIYLPQK